MNATKKKILASSLMLFNKSGISNISLRTIAEEIGISVGNLHYHFKKREEIIEMLYFEIVEKIDQIYVVQMENLLKSLFYLSNEISKIFFEYRFFFLDFITITRANPKIKKHYATLSKRREMEFLKIMDILIKNKIFREPILKNEYQNLYKRVEVLSNFWFSSILIQSNVLTKKSIKEYSLLMNQSMYPYLTPKTKKQFLTILAPKFLD